MKRNVFGKYLFIIYSCGRTYGVRTLSKPRQKRNTKNLLDIALVAGQVRSGWSGERGSYVPFALVCGSTTKSCQTRRILNINYIDSTNTKAKQTHFVIPPVSNLFCACHTPEKSHKIQQNMSSIPFSLSSSQLISILKLLH